ncbi:MAG: AsmA family protein [Acidiferrobacteraceae bacterium]
MRRFLRIVALVGLALVLLLIAAALILARVIHTRTYKAQLVALVHEQTGRILRINGPLRLEFFPWLGVRLAGVSLSNPPGFGPGPFASVRSAAIDVRLLPLFRRRIVIDRIRLDGLSVSLEKNLAGADNWAGLATHSKPRAVAPRSKPVESNAPLWQALQVAGVEVTHARLTFHDRKTKSAWSIDHLSLHAGRVVPGRPFHAVIAADVHLSHPKVSTHIKGDARILLSATRSAVTVSRLAVSALGISLHGDIHAILAPSRNVTGQLTVPAFNARKVLARLGFAPHLRDPKALTALALQAGVADTSQGLRLAPLTATLDGSHLTGNLSVTPGASTGAPPHYRFTASIDTLDLDRYRPPPAPPQANVPPPAPGAASSPSFLKALDARGSLGVAHLVAFGIHATDAHVGLRAAHGIIEIQPIKARLYGGTGEASVRYDVAGAAPALTFQEQLKQVALGPLLRDLHQFDRFSGTGDVSAEVKARGQTPAALTATLNGHIRVALTHGRIKGFDLANMVRQAQTVYDELRGQKTTVAPGAASETTFSTLTASALIQNGVVHNNDLRLLAPPYLTASGKGRVDLVAKNMNYRLLATATKPGGGSVRLPVTVRGPFSALSYHVDLARAIRSRAQKRIKIERKKLKSRLERELHNGLNKLLQ